MAHPQVVDRGTASNMDSSHMYIEYVVVKRQQEMVLQLGGWTRFYQLFTVKTGLVMKRIYVPRAWTDPSVQPKHWKLATRFGT
jgi:hypothetical protein